MNAQYYQVSRESRMMKICPKPGAIHLDFRRRVAQAKNPKLAATMASASLVFFVDSEEADIGSVLL